MISFEEAQRLIEKNIPRLKKKTVPLQDALGFILAEDVCAPIHLPVGDNSAMDGFVLRAHETRRAEKGKPISFKVHGDIRAGDERKHRVNKGEAYRIMTGAFIPSGADTVIPKEEAVLKSDLLVVDQPIFSGRHVRRRGEEIRKGRTVLSRGSHIHPATIGILATLGKEKIMVFDKPKVALLATGSELVKPGVPLKRGQIYDSNSLMIQSALKNMGICPFRSSRVKDNPKLLKKTVLRALKQSDVLILMGGVSVGEYDHVKDILKNAGVKTIFWKVSQKPGKPLFFGRKEKTLVFGLPGNPASVFTCFYEYAFSALRRMSGVKNPYLDQEMANMGTAVKPDQRKTLFLKAKTEMNGKEKTVVPLSRQGSHMLSSLQEADCFALIRPSRRGVKKGQKVRIDLLPVGHGGS